MYAGFYELRAYTRWQLDWAQSELPHDKGSEYWFHNDKMAREYFRDYTKIYSRTFPVYDRPLTPGDYTRDMTLRRMMRQYPPADQEPQLVLTFYPEGGNMVQGVENAVAFEVATDEGEAVEGTLSVARTQVATVHRGRGAFEVTPGGEDIEALFTSVDGRQVRATLPRAQASGVALRVERQPDTTLVHVRMAGAAVHTPLAVAVMHQGEPTHYQALATGAPAQRIVLPHAHLTPGVQQITIYDTQGRVWADRLFFHRTSSMGTPSVQILDVANEYTPRQPITLRLRGLPGAILSVAVRDAYTSDATYDSGNIFTEMLLDSEIKGFVPQPDWYFAKNDTLHRTALDLLMRTQGWRRYRWTDLAGGKWKPTEAAEPHMKLRGEVLTYAAQRRQETAQIEDAMRWEYDNLPPASTTKEAVANLMDAADAVRQSFGLSDGNERTQASQQYQAPPATTRVHMEYIQGQHGLEGFATRISNGVFEVSVPNFTGHSILHLAANDTAKWDKKKHTQKQWVMPTDEEYPEFCVRLCKPLPRHPQPYTFYHTHLPQANEEGNAPSPTLDGEHQLQQVSVHSRHGRLIRRMHVGPALRLDAYQAFNAAVDAGLLAPYYPGARAFADAVARCYVGDMGTNTRLQALLLPQIATSDASPRTAMAQMAVANSRAERRALAEQIAPSLVQRPKSADDNPSTTSGTTSHLPATQPMAHIAASMPQSATTHSQHQAELYHHLANLDSVYVYTDYAPRLRGDKRYLKPNVPEVAVYLKLLPEGKQRQTFRDRFIVMPGYATPHECYNPNYNQRTIRPRPADHRRTLYWHPAVALNEQGEATITLYNCSRTTRLAVEANGLTPQGVVLWGKE